jgi:hypothetical protein
MPESGKVFEDREHAGSWRVERTDDDGGCEVAIFDGPHARDRAILYANHQYGSFEQITLEPIVARRRVSGVGDGDDEVQPHK